MKNIIKIGNHNIGEHNATYIIAEMSANHNQDFEKAMKIVEAAKKAGADAIKLQTYTPDTITINCDNEYFRVKGTIWEGRTLYDLYGEAHTPWEWHPKLKKVADELGLDFFSSPFDFTAVDFLEKLKVPAYKVASFEIIDLALLKKIAGTGKPVIMSTGMAALSEIEESVRTLGNTGCDQLALLKCTSAYPAQYEEMNLRTIPHMAETFSVPVGLSDHTLGSAVSVAAVTLGARILEKHLTLSRSESGPDSSFSMEPHEFKQMVEDIRVAEKAIGNVCYDLTEKQKESIAFRRSLFVTKDIKAGDVLTMDNIRSIRPGNGLAPKFLEVVLGKKVNRDVKKGTPLRWDVIE
jgi:pseudaminic acid synthase